jgi:integrase
MICVKCRKNFQDDAVFCPYCGKKQTNLPRKRERRANNTGSVYYDNQKQKWVAQIVVGRILTKDKKIRFQYRRKFFDSRSEALKEVQKMDEKAKERPEFTVSYYYNSMTSYIEGLSKDKRSAYRTAFERIKTIHSTPVKDLTLPQLQEIIDTTVSTYYPAHDIRTLLNAIYRKAVADDKEINAGLPGLITLPKLEEAEVEPFTEEEQLKLWYSYEAGNIEAAAPLIMIYTGMMTGELRKLTKDMINLKDREIVKAGLKTKERKKRAVLLPDDIIPVLEDVMRNAETDKLYDLSEGGFYRMFYKALADAGITRKLTPYSCRHTTATVLAVHANIAPQVLQRVMRWKSTKMADKYVTPNAEDARKAVNKI